MTIISRHTIPGTTVEIILGHADQGYSVFIDPVSPGDRNLIGEMVTVHWFGTELEARSMANALWSLIVSERDARVDRPRKEMHSDEIPIGSCWRVGDQVYRVAKSRTTDRPYALVWDGERFEYAPGGYRAILASGQRLSSDEAAAFGRETGTCCSCGRALTNPASIEAGIGPVCAGRV